ncbi:MAG: EAL domain-containing protein [Clostridia bacterium]|nr:EAL domain-containing protein [Clostridia bacterium]
MNVLLDYAPDRDYIHMSSMVTLSYKDIIGNKSIGDELMDILENNQITTSFQPIISLKDGSVLGYEALSRGPSGSILESPANLFDVARVYGKLWELEYLCRIKALENSAKADSRSYFFLNVDPDIINDEKFKKGFTKEFLKKFGIDPGSIVFEITEKNSIADINSFKKTIDNYKDQGYKIAIDDTGSGYSGLKLITEIHPHFIKLDMSLIRGLDRDGLKYALIKTFYEFCLVTDIKLIAEGIETENELNALIDIGINYGQGYYIQKPSEQILDINPDLIKLIKSRNAMKRELYYSKPSTVLVGDISRTSTTIKPSETGSVALEIFTSNPSLQGLPVVENGKLTGLIMKDKFYAKLATQYGFALFLNRPVTLVMDNRPLAVDYETTIDTVSKLAMTRNEENLYDYIIVEKDSVYHGIVTVKDLLEKTTELEVSYAKHLNPLSGLPGNILIENKLKEYVESSVPFTVLYLDVDNFKTYNDVYGFENGDRMLQFLGRTIYDCIAASFCEHFIGHIGGDDFVIILESYDVDMVCQSIISAFEKGIRDFYSKEDVERGFILAKNRRGEEEKFGLATLSIAGISNKTRSYKNIYELAEQAGKLKHKCKQVWTSVYMIE